MYAEIDLAVTAETQDRADQILDNFLFACGGRGGASRYWGPYEKRDTRSRISTYVQLHATASNDACIELENYCQRVLHTPTISQPLEGFNPRLYDKKDDGDIWRYYEDHDDGSIWLELIVESSINPISVPNVMWLQCILDTSNRWQRWARKRFMSDKSQTADHYLEIRR